MKTPLSLFPDFRQAKKVAFFCFLSSFFLQINHAQDFNFRRFDIIDGLPHNFIYTLFQDKSGFIWIGTANGLARYDGSGFTVFKPSDEDPHSIRGPEIYTIQERADGQLWIGTNSGLNRYDPKTEHFHFYPLYDEKEEATNTLKVYVLFIREDQDGKLWLVVLDEEKSTADALAGRLVHFDPATEQVEAMTHDSTDINSIGFDLVFCHTYLSRTMTTKLDFPIVEDPQGRIWIGSTGSGLDRYDPATGAFRHYRHLPGQAHSLSSDTVYALFLDRENTLWAGTSNGLNRYDPESDDFTVFRPQEETAGEKSIMTINEDSDGYLWLSRPNSLERFNKKSRSFRSYRHPQPNSSMNLSIWLGEISTDKILFIYPTWAAVLEYDKDKDSLNLMSPPNPNEEFSNRNYVSNGLIDRTGLLWLVELRNSLHKQEKPRYSFKEYPENTISDSPLDLHLGRKGAIWISMRNGGITRLDPLTGDRIEWKTGSKFSTGFHVQETFFHSLQEDNNGNLWIGTSNSGLVRMNKSNDVPFLQNLALGQPVTASSTEEGTGFLPAHVCDGNPETRWASQAGDLHWITIDLGQSTSIGRIVLKWESAYAKSYDIQVSDNGQTWRTVYSENEGEDGVKNIYLETTGRFVRLYLKERGTRWAYSLWEIEVYPPLPGFSHYKHSPSNPYSIPSDTINDLHLDQRGRLWVASPKGLSRYDAGRDGFIHYQPRPSAEEDAFENYIAQIEEDTSGAFWLLPGGIGVYRFSPETSSFKVYDLNERNGTEYRKFQHIYQNGGTTWFLTYPGGVTRYRPETDDFAHFLEETYFSSIYQDRKGRLWLGSQEGFFLFDPVTGDSRHYTERNGLVFDDVQNIQEDDQGYIWLGTLRGLSRFDPESETFYNLVAGKELPEMKGWLNSIRSREGTFFYFESYGRKIYSIQPSQHQLDTIAPDISVTRIKIRSKKEKEAEQTIFLPESQTDDPAFSWPFHRNHITFEFAGFHFANPAEHKYQVMLEPNENEWTDIGNSRSFQYIGLAPGTYTFRVRSSNGFDVWNEKGTALSFVIRPPWWRSWWAYSLYLLATGTLVFWWWKTEQRKQVRKLEAEQQVNAQLRRVDQLKDQFLANTSHELRTPLQGIIGLSESLYDEAEVIPPETLKENLEMITSSGRRLNSLVNDILDFSKIKNRDIVLQQKPLNFRVLSEIVLKNISPLARGKDLDLVMDIPGQTPLVFGDENRLQQILYNLVGNAIKFTEKGYVKVGVLQADKEGITVYVRDTGIGIPEDKRDAIFQEFEQGDGSISREFAGTGLGLSISKRLVELQGGQMWVESTVGEGSTFFFTLPVAGSASQISQAPTQKPVDKVPVFSSDPQGSSKKKVPGSMAAASATTFTASKAPPLPAGSAHQIHILVVDDEPINQQVLKNHLSGENYRITQAMNGEEALKILQNGDHFDLVLLDIMMPRMSGYQVCEKIRERHLSSELPVIMITAKDQVRDIVQGLSLGANDYLTKPFSKEELLARIHTQLDLHHIFNVTSRFVPNEFIQSLGRQRITEVALGDHILRDVTVMFSDIRDYTSLSETMSPEENYGFVQAFNRRMGPVIRSHGGFVNQYLGDAIMAIFPGKITDALAAAVDMQRSLRRYNQERQVKGRIPVLMGTGLHSGPLIMGIIGDEERLDAATIADTVNTASRLENLTKHYGASLLLSEDSRNEYLALSGGDLFFRHLGAVVVKGKKEPIGIYECIDGDPPEVFELKKATASQFQQGLDLYLSRSFVRAAAAFQEIIDINPKDMPARHFLRKAAHYINVNVPDDWTGVERMDEK